MRSWPGPPIVSFRVIMGGKSGLKLKSSPKGDNLRERSLNKYKFNGVKAMTESKFNRVTLGFSSFLIILAASLFSYSASAQVLTIPNTFTAGEAAVAAEVNANFDAVATAVNGQVSMADVMTFFLPDETAAAGDVVGTAELTRHAAGVYLTAYTTMWGAGDAYTLWWIIFNNPAACDPAGCTGDDSRATVTHGPHPRRIRRRVRSQRRDGRDCLRGQDGPFLERHHG